MGDGLADIAQMDLLAVHEQLAGDVGAVAVTEDGHGQLRSARTHQAGDAHHLALADMEGNIVDDLLVGIDGMIDIPVFDLHGHVADFHIVALGEAVGDLPANHALDDPVLADIVGALVQRLDGMAVTDDGDVIGNVGYLVELMGDDDGGHALLLEPQQQIQKCLGIGLIQRRGGLVQDQQPGIL